VVILDYTLFDFTGPEDLHIISDRYKSTHWILFSDELSSDFLRNIVYSSCAFSIIFKDCSKEEISSALSLAVKNERYICNRASNQLLGVHNVTEKQNNTLTVTEKEILRLIALGKTTKEIAAERFSSIHTITTHRKNIFRKLEVNSIHEATKYALRAGIIDSAEYYI
jgi:DNA-binding NarL/FixJ family response regulator